MAVDIQRERSIFKEAAGKIRDAEPTASSATIAGAFLAESARRAVRSAVSLEMFMKMAKFSYEASTDEMSKENI